MVGIYVTTKEQILDEETIARRLPPTCMYSRITAARESYPTTLSLRPIAHPVDRLLCPRESVDDAVELWA